MNPFKTVPAIVDNDFKLAESVAIFRYLARRHQIDDHWYPKEDQARARIDEYLEWQHSNTRQTCFQYFLLAYMKPRKLGPSADDAQINAAAQRQMGETLDKIEKVWLKDGPFIGGRTELSFADILAACEIEQPSELLIYRSVFRNSPDCDVMIHCLQGSPGTNQPTEGQSSRHGIN